MLQALLVTLVASPNLDWQVSELHRWLTSAQGPGRVGDAANTFPGAVELTPGSPEYSEVGALVRRGCALTNEPVRPEPPTGHLWQADLEGDGTPERFFTGGCSPAPYFVVLKKQPAGWAVWHEGRGLLLDVKREAGETVFEVASNGYGIDRESLWTLLSVDGAGRVTWRREFRAVGSDDENAFASSPAAKGERCTLRRTAALRAEPKVNDAPQESGMGFEYPGNLLQMLSKDSVGLSVGTSAKGSFRLCAFAATAPAPDVVKGMRTASLRTLTPPPTEFIVGWVPEAALRR